MSSKSTIDYGFSFKCLKESFTIFSGLSILEGFVIFLNRHTNHLCLIFLICRTLRIVSTIRPFVAH